MTFALLLPLLFSAIPARAQVGGYYAGPVYSPFIITTDSSGNSTLVWPDLIDTSFGAVSYSDMVAGIDASVEATFTWTALPGMSEAGPPPDKVYFRETGNASAGDFFWNGNSLPSSGPQADNGLGDAPVQTTETPGPLIAFDCSSTGSHVRQKSGGTVTFDCALSSSLTGSYVAGSCYISYKVVNLGQFLIASSIDASRHYGAATMPDVYDAVTINKRESDGSITGDSVAEWDYANQKWVGNATFTAGNIGFNSPTWQWNITGNLLPPPSYPGAPPVPVDLTTQSVSLIFDLGDALGQQTLGQTSESSCTATDSEGSTADNKYKINWHLPLEEWSEYQPAVEEDEPQAIGVNAPGYAKPGGTIGVTWGGSDFWGDVGGTLNLAANFIANPVYSGLCGVAGLVASDAGPQPAGDASYEGCWDKPASTFIPSKMEDQKDNYHMVPKLVVPMRTRFWEGKEYGPHGYIGTERKETKKQYKSEKFAGVYTLYSSQDPGGPNGH